MSQADAPKVLLIIRRAMIANEEAFLERRFGSAYTDYKARSVAGRDGLCGPPAHDVDE
jgi:hypothetical protein